MSWRTLKHMNHGEAFKTFAMEMYTAIENEMSDHREKVIKRLVKMQACRDGEAKLGNAAAAESFAAAINKMLIENELSPSALDYAAAADDDPVIEVPVDFGVYKIEAKRARVAWQETLARVVARANLCTFLLRTGSNRIWFVGTKRHAVTAEYTYGTLVPVAIALCDNAYRDYGMESIAEHGKWKARAPGFREAWMNAFINRIAERFEAARTAAVAEAPEGTSTGLMRLNGAMQKVHRYVDDRFKGRRGSVGALGALRSRNSAGSGTTCVAPASTYRPSCHGSRTVRIRPPGFALASSTCTGWPASESSRACTSRSRACPRRAPPSSAPCPAARALESCGCTCCRRTS